MSDPVKKPRGSFRTAGINNIVISAVVAVLSYFSFVLVARTFGGSIGSDAYFFLFSINTIASGIITCLYSVVLLPIFVDIKYKEGLSRAGEFAGSILMLSILCVIPIAVAAYVWYGQFFAIFSKFNTSQIDAARFILIYFAPLFVITVISEFFRTLILASGYYTLAALGAIFQPALLIASIYTCSATLKEEALSLSLISSRFLLLVFVVAVISKIVRIKIPLCLKPDPMLGRFFKVSAPYWSANIVSGAATFYFDYSATGLGTGILSALAYAQKIYNLPVAVVLNPIFEIARTRFCEAQATNNAGALANQHNQLMQGVLYFTIPVSVIFYFFSNEIIASMFQRGAFRKENVAIAAECLSLFALSIPFSALFSLNGRAVESFQRLSWPCFFGTAGQFISIFITFMLVNKFGYKGIPIAKVCIDLCYFFPFGFIAVRFFMGQFNLLNIARVTTIALVSSLGVVLIYVVTGLPNLLKPLFPSFWILTLLLCVVIAGYCLVVLSFDKSLRHLVLEGMRRRIGG